MENDPHEMMLEMERAEAAPYIRYKPTPWWFAPYFGLYVVGLVLAFSWTSEEHRILYFAMMGALVVSFFLLIRYLRRRDGVLPMLGRGNPPPEIARMYRLYLWSVVAVGATLVACWFLLPTPVTAVIAFVTVTAGIHVFGRYYDRAAAAVRERLS